MSKRKRKVHEGKLVTRVSIYVRVEPIVEELLNRLAETWFPHRKKNVSITIQKLIIDAALAANIINKNTEEYEKVIKIKKKIAEEMTNKHFTS